MVKDIKIKISQPTVNVKSISSSKKIDFNLDEKIEVVDKVKNHRDLLGLDYASSGHTGFASQEELYNDYSSSMSIAQDELTGIVTFLYLIKMEKLLILKL